MTVPRTSTQPEVTWLQLRSHQPAHLHRVDNSVVDTPSDYRGDEYRSDGYRSGSDGRLADRVFSTFSDDPDSNSDRESEESSLGDSEDDVPLAKRIPGALQAQKSIRVKDQEEREYKRKEKLAYKQHLRTQPYSRPAPIPAEDLTQKLLHAQEALGQTSVLASQQPEMPASSVSKQPVIPRAASVPRRPGLPSNPSPHTRNMPQNENQFNHVSQEIGSPPVSRQQTTVRPRNPSLSHPISQPSSSSRTVVLPNSSQSLSRSVTTARREGSSATSKPQVASELLLPQSSSRKSQDTPSYTQSDTGHRRSHDAQEQYDSGVVRARTLSSSARPSQRVLQRSRTAATSLPPPLPIASEAKHQSLSTNAIQHRVFIGDMQRFNTVEIGPQTRACDVLDLVEAQGELRGEPAAQLGGWMLWEIAQDFGMERPLRDYELPAEIYASWNSNTRLNSFLIKKTTLAPLLAAKAIPRSSPTFSGHVQWESKRGKWNKRWMELREHSLWLSKRENDSTFLCSLSNFDCYFVSRLHKAPKAFVFAVKSTDNLTLFENPADYLHIFSCDRKEGQQWMENILLARSYVLHKERTVLFGTPTTYAANYVLNQNASKVSTVPRVAGPLVNITSQSSPGTSGTNRLFQSGTLLGKSPT